MSSDIAGVTVVKPTTKTAKENKYRIDFSIDGRVRIGKSATPSQSSRNNKVEMAVACRLPA
jgi:hypothetical protein